MSTEKRPQLPRTDEVQLLGSQEKGVEHLAGTILLDRYRLIKLHGSGGASVVYRAEHTIMHKPVAVKVLRPELAVRQDFVQRFLAEARTVARLRHEHIVDIVDVGRTEAGIVFCVMEFLEGEELGETLEREGPMPWPRARDIVTQVCRALAATHAAGVVHRDIKPQNCFRIRHGNNPDFIKLLDFGIAKQTDNDQGLTATGVIMGTAEYMSPEQARGKDVDARADIYSVGAMLFELLAGRPPFEGDTFIDVLVKHSSEPPPRLSSLVRGLDPAIDAVVARTLAKKPKDRFSSVEQLMAAFVVNDGNSFQGMFDGAILTERPESVLPRASSSQQVVGALNRLDRGTLVALVLGLLLVPIIVVFAVHWSADEDAVTIDGDPAAPLAVAETEVEDRERAALSPETEKLPAPPPTPAPRVEETPDSPPTEVPQTNPAPEVPPVSDTPEILPDEPSTAEPKPKSTPPKTLPSNKPRPSRAERTKLTQRIQESCKDWLRADKGRTLDLLVEATGIHVLRSSSNKLLDRCVEKVRVGDLTAGTYRLTVIAPKPKTMDPFEDDPSGEPK